MYTYAIERYAAEGSRGEPSDGRIIARTRSLREARAAVRRQLGSLRSRKWDARLFVRDEWVGLLAEAYHDHPRSHPEAHGCGGFLIFREPADFRTRTSAAPLKLGWPATTRGARL